MSYSSPGIVLSAGGSLAPTPLQGPNPQQSGNYGDLNLLASTGPAGVPLVNATPILLAVALPNDGLLHRVIVMSLIVVTVTQVGGAVQINPTPAGSFGATLQPGGLAAPASRSAQLGGVVLGNGTTLNVQESVAQTSGASTFYCEIWGS